MIPDTDFGKFQYRFPSCACISSLHESFKKMALLTTSFKTHVTIHGTHAVCMCWLHGSVYCVLVMCACMHTCVRACVCACVCARARACACACECRSTAKQVSRCSVPLEGFGNYAYHFSWCGLSAFSTSPYYLLNISVKTAFEYYTAWVIFRSR